MKSAFVLVPFLVLLHAAPGGADEKPAIDLVGVWDNASFDTRITYTVKADGSFTRLAVRGEERAESAGRWSLDGDVVTIVVESETLALKVRRVDDDHLDFWLKAEDGDGDATVRRWVRRREDAAPPPKLPGTWVLKEEGLDWTLDLRADGAYAFHRETRGEVKEDAGTWKATFGTLLLLSGGKEDEMVGFNLRFLTAEKLELTLGIRAGKPKVWRRKEAGKEEAGLVGAWRVKGETVSVFLRIEADGRFHHEVRTPTGKEVTTGTWKVEGDKLIAKPEDEPATYTLTWKLHGRNRLELFDPTENETTLLQREGTEPGRPWATLSPEVAKLAGTWIARSEVLELTIVLTKDGTFEQTVRTTEGSDRTAGYFNVEAGHFLFVAKGETGVQKVPFAFDGRTLTLKQGGQVLAQLVRQGS